MTCWYGSRFRRGWCSSTAFLVLVLAIGLGGRSASLAPLADYGDAPDGQLCGYAVDPTQDVMGRFPTLFSTTNARLAGYPGAHCLVVGQEALGAPELTSRERDANDPDDPDGTTNLVDDDLDDGLIVVLMPDGTLQLRVVVQCAVEAAPGTRYLNVLYDLNRDGEWRNTPSGEEWIVTNHVVSLTPGERKEVSIAVPLGSDWIAALSQPRWMRLALTTEKVNEVAFAAVGGWDGSGQFASGEIEDWKLGAATAFDLVWAARSAFRVAWAWAEVHARAFAGVLATAQSRATAIVAAQAEAQAAAQAAASAKATAEAHASTAAWAYATVQAAVSTTRTAIVKLPCGEVRAKAEASVGAAATATASAHAAAQASAQAAASASARAEAWSHAAAVAVADARAAAVALAAAGAQADAAAGALAASWADARAWSVALAQALGAGSVPTEASALALAWAQARAWALTWAQAQASASAWARALVHVQTVALAYARAQAAAAAAAEARAVAQAAAQAAASASAAASAGVSIVAEVGSMVAVDLLPCWCPKEEPKLATYFGPTYRVAKGEAQLMPPWGYCLDLWRTAGAGRTVTTGQLFLLCMPFLGCQLSGSRGSISGVTFELAASGTFVASLGKTATGLPPGLQFDSGILYGVPTQAGTWRPLILARDTSTGNIIAGALLTLEVEEVIEDCPVCPPVWQGDLG